MRLILIPLLLAACSPAPAPPAPNAAVAPSERSVANADALALQRAPAPGAWSATADEGVFVARFGAADAPPLVTLRCTAPNGALSLTLAQEPAQTTSLRLITATHTLDLPADADGHALTAAIAESAPEHAMLITVLGAPNDHIALDAGGALTVLPWDDAIATTLIACR
jgi:hypothetical protein